MTSTTTSIVAKYNFSPDELTELSERMATAACDLADMEEQKAQEAKVANALIKQQRSRLLTLARARKLEWENRQYDCHMQKDPIHEQRVWVDSETGNEVRRDPFQPEDFQTEMDFESPAPDHLPEEFHEPEPGSEEGADEGSDGSDEG